MTTAPISRLLAVLLPLALPMGFLPGAGDLQTYTETIPGTTVSFDLVKIPGGSFMMGGAPADSERESAEEPYHEVLVSDFWMGTHEVTWDEYNLFLYGDVQTPGEADGTDAVTRPSPFYGDPTFGFGQDGYPVIAVSHYGAIQYCRWLSRLTKKNYRLPTEAEWEYAARAGTATVYFWGDDKESLELYSWYESNSGDKTHPVGQKKPNPWGLFDILGNVSEWVLDAYQADFYGTQEFGSPAKDPLAKPFNIRYPNPARGGSWRDHAKDLRCSKRLISGETWSSAKLAKSTWWDTAAHFVGFRVVRTP